MLVWEFFGNWCRVGIGMMYFEIEYVWGGGFGDVFVGGDFVEICRSCD